MFGWYATGRGMAQRRVAASMVFGALAALVALSGCGGAMSSATTGGGTTSATTGGSFPGGAMVVRPCPGLTGDASGAGALALILTRNNASGSLPVGELAQVRLPATLHWTLTTQSPLLASVGTAGGQDTTLNVCYWTFRAVSAGSVTLRYSGVQPCDPPAIPCSD